MVMTRRQLMRVIDTQTVEETIAAAERTTSAEILVSVAPLFWGDVYGNAQRAFERLGVAQTRERNGVLFFLVPSRRRFAVLGDEGIHARVGQEFWDEVRDVLGGAFHERAYTRGLVDAITTVGRRLADHFPARPEDNPNELSNAIDFGRRSDR